MWVRTCRQPFRILTPLHNVAFTTNALTRDCRPISNHSLSYCIFLNFIRTHKNLIFGLIIAIGDMGAGFSIPPFLLNQN